MVKVCHQLQLCLLEEWKTDTYDEAINDDIFCDFVDRCLIPLMVLMPGLLWYGQCFHTPCRVIILIENADALV